MRPQYGRQHRQLRELVLDRAGGICEECMTAFAVHAHHLRPDATTPDHYQAVCQSCHDAIHKRERAE